MRLIYGVGINDGLKPAKVFGEKTKHYDLWRGMIRRCYSEKEHLEGKFLPYIDCTVSDNFKSYSYFYEWCQTQKGFGEDGFELEKDLLNKGNKEYSEDNCVFLPKEINTCITNAKWKRGEFLIGVTYRSKEGRFHAQISIGGKNKTVGYFKNEIDAFYAYKKAKEEHIKTLAEKYRDFITEKAYISLMNYKVDITD